MSFLQQIFTSNSKCSTQSLPYPNIFGTEILSLEASLTTNYSHSIPEWYYSNHPATEVENASFCNVTISYTHPGQNDVVNVQVWLPTSTWNGRLQGIGGAGWTGGLSTFSSLSMAGAVGEGYMAVTTDGGHNSDISTGPDDWALISPGNVNLYALQNFGSVSLNDSAFIAKDLARNFYGSAPVYSYWSGCSQGGRQGLMLAQRYPTAYDGIVASAPAINWNKLLIGDYWAGLIMNQLGKYPQACELDALTAAAVSACDGVDGLVDGIISDPDICDFNPYTLVNTTIKCTDTGLNIRISETAATIAHAAWTGARTKNGSFLWYGVGQDASLTSSGSVAQTTCSNNGTCTGKPVSLFTDWIRYFVAKDANYNVAGMTHADYETAFRASYQQFASFIESADTDLSAFRDAGGKMLTYHGLADQIIPSKGTRQYYESVMAGDPDVQSYYRLFESPGLAHCYGGSGAYPAGIFEAMRAWVENGTVPESLDAHTGAGVQRKLCPWPSKARYVGGSGKSTDSFRCSL